MPNPPGEYHDRFGMIKKVKLGFSRKSNETQRTDQGRRMNLLPAQMAG